MSKWFKKYRHNKTAKLRLFCFPYAGGNATIFEGWEKSLPDFVDVFAIQAPGRTVRFAEKPIASLREKVDILAKEIAPYLDVPHIFVGHSNGALTAFELARELQLRNSGGTRLRHLVLSAKRAPHLPKRERIHDLPYREFVQKLRQFEATPVEILEQDDLMQLLEPMLRADFALSETHTFRTDVQLESPTTLFWGDADHEVPKEDMLAWQEHVTREIRLIEFNGGHFFINHNRTEFLGHVRNIVEGSLN